MRVRRFRRDLPGYDAFYERSILRHEKFSIAILRSAGLALDAGVWARRGDVHIPLKRAAELAGYRSPIAMNHALSSRGAPSPGALRKLLTERWA